MNEEIIKLYKEGKSMREIEKLTHHSRSTISKILKENDIHIRYQNETSKLYKCNDDYFEQIDNPEKAYWLGFLMADGFIESKRTNGNQKIGLTLGIKDKEHVEKFNKCLDSTYPIKIYKGSGYNPDGLFAKLLITSQKMVDDLKRHGIVENKTNIAQFPDSIPIEYQIDFIRGYFDGDGSIYFDNMLKAYRIGMVGTKQLLEKIAEILDIKTKISHEKGHVYCLMCNSRDKLNEVLHKMYDNSTVHLDRKHEIFLDYLKYIEK